MARGGDSVHTLSLKNHEIDEIIHAATETPIDHPVPIDPALILSNLITTLVGGKKLELIIEISLKKTDLDGHQARLSMPRSHTLREFSTKDEEEWLEAKEKLPGMVIDPCLCPHAMKLSKWKYHKNNKNTNKGCIDQSRRSWSYVLISGWNKLREANALFLKVWSFRVEDMLGLGMALKFDLIS
ncbi:hypothetical protein Cgig2_023726 [Carnegiea gigantea]|uniref:Uncharacterized protein n=1 Tax=Carnegiea gigantea TaxID=171969 RepID=A0A9Q1KKV8_9CARY|nr:hypothetical protein Cgig2_023726 [Carnegiea gigantea]